MEFNVMLLEYTISVGKQWSKGDERIASGR
jgi:hypothetical protein